MNMIEQHRQQIATLTLCEALDVPKASFYRQQAQKDSSAPVVPRTRPEHALSDSEQQTVLATLHLTFRTNENGLFSIYEIRNRL